MFIDLNRKRIQSPFEGAELKLMVLVKTLPAPPNGVEGVLTRKL